MLLAETAAANSIVSDGHCEKKFHIGPKASATFALGEHGSHLIHKDWAGGYVITFADELKQYGAANSKLTGGVGDFSRLPAAELFSSNSGDIEIEVRTENRSQLAMATIATSSMSCPQPPENWRPYWRDFLAFMQSKHYKRLK